MEDGIGKTEFVKGDTQNGKPRYFIETELTVDLARAFRALPIQVQTNLKQEISISMNYLILNLKELQKLFEE